MIKPSSRILGFIVLILGFLAISNGMKAQTIVQHGTVFVQKPDSTKSQGIPTEYKYQDSKGNVYPIFLTTSGKAFIWKVSKKTGNKYRQYLPKVTEVLSRKKIVYMPQKTISVENIMYKDYVCESYVEGNTRHKRYYEVEY